MKRFVSLLILVFYTAGILNATVSFHYCGGTLQSVALNTSGPKGCCDATPNEDDADDCCCINKKVSASLSHTHIAADNYKIKVKSFSAHSSRIVAVCPSSFLISITSGDSHKFSRNTSPPNPNGPPLFIRHRVLRI